MTDFEIISVREIDADRIAVNYTDHGAPARTVEHQLPKARVAAQMGEYGIEDPAEALDLLLHSAHLAEYAQALDPRDDPAAVAGWVLGTGPDAQTITTYLAESTRDAGGAYRCRADAVKANHVTITDPGGLLPVIVPADGLVAHHMALADVTRWETTYGGLPEPDGALDAPLILKG
jgi:hypothetical protein